MKNFKLYDEQAEQILANMSIKEKVGQLYQIQYNYKNFDEVAKAIKERKAGSVILAGTSTASDDEQVKLNVTAINEFQRLAMENGGIPIIIGHDVIHGHRIAYPIPLAMAATFNPELIKKCYHEIAEEASRDGIHWSFAPMADISRDPRWGRCIEGFGEDPYLGAEMAKGAIEGFQGDDYTRPDSIAACVKHFVGYGASEGGRDYAPTDIGERNLRNFYLRAFDAAVKAGVATVMTSFNFLSGVSVSLDKHLLREILKEEFGFDGFVVSDWASVQKPFYPARALESESECAEYSMKAGVDMEMVSTCYLDNIESLINEGRLSVELLNDAVKRILRVKLAFGLFENNSAPTGKVDYNAHLESATKAAEEAIVLLKNKDNTLPLSRNKKIAFVGPMLDQTSNFPGAWSLDHDIKYIRSYKDVLEQDYPDVAYSFNETALYDSMLLAARKAEAVVVMIGESRMTTGERHSLASVNVPEEQEILIKKLARLGKKVIAVMNFGRVAAAENIEPYCDAMLYCWHAGSGTAKAVIKTIFGENVPSGSLPMTMLRRTEQVPLYYNAQRTCTGIDEYYNNCGVHGYEDMLQTPLYPFGYGLSYTEFEYSEPWIENSPSLSDIKAGGTLKVAVKVRNTGKFDAYETVQCYLSDEYAHIARSIRELCGFRKEFLKVGEEKTIVFDIGAKALGYYNAESKFTVEKGKFIIYIGRDSYTANKIEFVLE